MQFSSPKARYITGYISGIISGIIIMSMLWACNQVANKTNKDTAIADSVVKDTVPAEAEKKHDFSSAEDALQYMKDSEHWDKYNQGILPRMVDENLPYAKKLLNNEHDYFIVVDKGTMRVLLYDKYGCKVKEYGMACARNYGQKRKKGDCRTPEGFFSAEGIYDSTEWLYTDDDGVTHPGKGVYGERYIRIDNPITYHVGLHGTNAPWSIGHRASHGCVRMRNEDNLDIVQYVEKGTPIIINPGPRDISVNNYEGNDVSWITVDDKPIVVKDYPYPYKEEEKKDEPVDTIIPVVEESVTPSVTEPTE